MSAKETVKMLLFAALVLLVGQIRIGSSTIASHFQKSLVQAWEWGKEKLKKSELIASTQRYGPENEENADEPGEENKPEAESVDADSVAPADHESLLRLLQ